MRKRKNIQTSSWDIAGPQTSSTYTNKSETYGRWFLQGSSLRLLLGGSSNRSDFLTTTGYIPSHSLCSESVGELLTEQWVAIESKDSWGRREATTGVEPKTPHFLDIYRKQDFLLEDRFGEGWYLQLRRIGGWVLRWLVMVTLIHLKTGREGKNLQSCGPNWREEETWRCLHG